jgi:hypothetical protein
LFHPWEFILTEAAVSTLISIKPERDRAFDFCKVSQITGPDRQG